ncbi:MAG: TolC family protein [Abditibacteriales bacterium]|nr:TolC family protein [Abditibacteriales bacterium]MDW8364640.1 TolC family protein [Abditibacteriales bacterium]
MKQLLIALTLLTALTLPVLGQDNQEFDLPMTVQTALKNHPSLRGMEAQVEAAQARLKQAAAGYAPKVNATLSYTLLQKDPSFTVMPFGTLVFGEKDNKQVSLTLQFPLSTGGKLEGMTRQARAGVEALESALDRQRQTVATEATIAYLNVLKARGFVKVAEDQLKALESQRNSIAKMLERGVATRIDLLRAETAVSAAQEMLTKAKNGEAVATAALANAMGLQQRIGLKVQGSVEAASPFPPHPATLEEAIAEALRARPELRQVGANRQAAEAGVQVARSGQKPSVGLFAQYDAERPTFMPRTGKWSAGVALTMNLSDGGTTKAEVAQARAHIAQVDAALEELRNGIVLQVTAAFLNVQSAKERLATTEKAVATAEEGVRLTQLGYQNGVNTITDFLAAQAELTKAQNDRVTALFDLRAAEAELQYAMGRQPYEAGIRGSQKGS